MLEFHTCNKTCFQHAPKFHQTFLKQVVNNFQEYPECFPVWGLLLYKPYVRSGEIAHAACAAAAIRVGNRSCWPWIVSRIPHTTWSLGWCWKQLKHVLGVFPKSLETCWQLVLFKCFRSIGLVYNILPKAFKTCTQHMYSIFAAMSQIPHCPGNCDVQAFSASDCVV
jgi:hypothetical protein